MKKFLCLLFVCIFCLFSCSEKNIEKYKNDVSIDDISTAVLEMLNVSSITKADESWIALNLPINTDVCEEYAVLVSMTGSADIVGLFKADSTENADEVLNQSKEYLTNLEANWMSEYLPEELPKVENSVCKKMGNYVIFLILDDSLKVQAEKTVKDMLTVN